MTIRRLVATYAVIGSVIGLPFTVIHLMAAPDDAPITPVQHCVAVIANFFGPWGVVVVRLADFPNAGLRSFSWTLAVGLTLFGAVILTSASRVTRRPLQVLLGVVWTLFLVVWFAVGLRQIADGLL